MTNSQRIPNWQLERLALAELPAHERADLEARLAAEVGGDARLAAIGTSNDEILNELPTANVLREIERRHRTVIAAQRMRTRRRLWVGGAFAAATAVVLFFALPRSSVMPDAPLAAVPDHESGVRIKGDARLLLHRKTGDAATKLVADSVAYLGDRIQLSYRAAGDKHGVIASIDGRGQVTVHFPDAGQTTLLRTGKVQLRHSYQLDDAPEFERFFFITSDQPIDVTLAISSLRKLADNLRQARQRPIALPSSLRQWSILLRKGPSQ